ncbi:MAG: PVC-type heme-binding CxxCH protein [Prosthecobacter sp.]|uniref:PVC-type heme-binding CxxCH protein n=1 Tax=Prosthecobacter sp. TaxID=1965333 RepID=UPI003902A6B0
MRPSLLFLALIASTALHAEPVAIFDGKTLENWDFDPAMWRVEDGLITGGSTTEKIKKNDFISTKKSYQNFELKLKIKVSGDPKTGLLNSGIQIRSVRADGGAMSGYQIDCGAGWFGKIYDEHRRNKVIWAPTPEQQAALDKAIDVFGWNEYRIRAEGPRIQTWINGVLCIDYTETDPNIALDGHIAPQVHSGGVCLVQVKDVTIEELPATPGIPTWEKVGHPKPKAAFQNEKGKKRDTSYNNVEGTAKSAAEQQKLFHLPDGYEIELVVQESEGLGKFVSVYFDQRGRLWTQTALEYPVDANENPAAAEAVYAGKGKDKVLVYPRESVNGPIPAGGLTNPTVFADGLAIPLGILPWGNGDTCYVQHGHDLKLYKDTNGDSKADTHEVILTGFGVQDSHLFPHQFTRAPGGWIWMAQGLFNNSKVHKPGSDVVVDYPKCGMARFRPDGTEFEMTSIGPNNIWGLVITGEGETFIQEANDYGYPVMPFHEYAYYPGGMEALKKSYQPDFPPQADFRMGGTGLSGLALIESGSLKDKQAAHTMAVANPITSKIQTIAMHRDGAYWKLAQLPDLITCDDPFFRPVALTNGPDGCIYIVDWYNKIISHNEVPRAHPDRDKTRGRIWRVKPKAAKAEVADFTKLSTDELITSLGKEPVAKVHLAWQTLLDRKQLPQSHFAAQDYLASTQFGQISQIGRNLSDQNISTLLAFAKPSLPNGPTTASSRGPKQIPVREAYDREFELFLVRMFLERHPGIVAKFLDSEAAAKLPVEARVLASLALEPKASASRVAKLLPQLDRAPNDEELLRLAQFPAEPGVGEALQALLTNEKSRAAVAEKLLAQRTKLDADQIAPLLTETARSMLRSVDAPIRNLALQLIGGFQLTALENDLVQPLKTSIAISGGDLSLTLDSQGTRSGDPNDFVALLRALKELHSDATDVFVSLIKISPPVVRDAALEALAASRASDAATKLLVLYPDLLPAQRHNALNALSSSKTGAKTIVTALLDKTLPQTDLDGPTVERLATVLGNDPALEKLQQQLGGIFREVLLLDGQDTAWVDSKITLDGPFTVETWVRLAPNIGNEDDILGAPGGTEMNFHQSKFRVFGGRELHDVCVATKPMTPDLWTHIAVTRDAKGLIRIYQNGELDATSTKPAPAKWENCRIGWSGPKGGTEGAMMEFRVWKTARSATEIRGGFDRSYKSNETYRTYPKAGDTFGKGARIAKTIDTPPLLTEEQAKALDTKFAKFSALAPKGNATNGKVLSALCMACHQIGNAGGQIGPNLSGAGAMGLEAVLRNILTPNAAMEPGYRIFRVEMKNGDLIDAFFVSEDKDATIIRMPGLQDRRLDKKDIRSTKFIRRSLMPEGLLDTLPDQQVADLLAYLMTLKG